ncbi:MAG: HigA family addiction module antitoxin [Alphaproteobacteria bacterium]|nr:HigA family addiction module antitoxin [Alphaproteobacteria bacterium]
MTERLKNIHPGEVLLEEFLKPFGLSQNKVAKGIGVAPRRINEIILGRRGITANTAIRLAYYFGTSEEFWMELQDKYELEEAHLQLNHKLKTLVHPLVRS